MSKSAKILIGLAAGAAAGNAAFLYMQGTPFLVSFISISFACLGGFIAKEL